MTTNAIEEYYDLTDELNLEEANFRFAIGAKELYNNKSLHNPRYVKWIAKINGNSPTGERSGFEEIIELYPCTESDLAKFYPINEKQI